MRLDQQHEIVLRDRSWIGKAGEFDGLGWTPIEGDQRIGADVLDLHACNEVTGANPER